MRKRLIIAALAAMALVVVAGSALAANGHKSVIFDSTNPNGPKTNLPSYGPTAYSFNSIGDQITFEPDTARSLTNVTVTLSSWACQDGQLERQRLRHGGGSDVLAADHADDLERGS